MVRTDHFRGDTARSQSLFGTALVRTAPHVPERHSSAACSYRAGYRTGLQKATTPNGPSPDDDPYMRALKQLSATHRPSLDNLALDRPAATNAADPTPPDTTAQQIPPTNPRGGPAGESASQPPIAGQRYHTRPDGTDYIEPVNGTSSGQEILDHSTPNKVRPATGVSPFHPASDTDHARGSKFAALNRMPTFRYSGEGPTSAASSDAATGVDTFDFAVGQRQEGREDRRSRWLRWHILGPKPQLDERHGAPALPERSGRGCQTRTY
jgi:hypothetical protein